MPENPNVVMGSVSQDDEQGVKPGARDVVASSLFVIGLILVLAGVELLYGWKYVPLVAGSLAMVLGILLGIGGDEK